MVTTNSSNDTKRSMRLRLGFVVAVRLAQREVAGTEPKRIACLMTAAANRCTNGCTNYRRNVSKRVNFWKDRQDLPACRNGVGKRKNPGKTGVKCEWAILDSNR